MGAITVSQSSLFMQIAAELVLLAVIIDCLGTSCSLVRPPHCLLFLARFSGIEPRPLLVHNNLSARSVMTYGSFVITLPSSLWQHLCWLNVPISNILAKQKGTREQLVGFEPLRGIIIIHVSYTMMVEKRLWHGGKGGAGCIWQLLCLPINDCLAGWLYHALKCSCCSRRARERVNNGMAVINNVGPFCLVIEEGQRLPWGMGAGIVLYTCTLNT